jgi:hypothetical protein
VVWWERRSTTMEELMGWVKLRVGNKRIGERREKEQ